MVSRIWMKTSILYNNEKTDAKGRTRYARYSPSYHEAMCKMLHASTGLGMVDIFHLIITPDAKMLHTSAGLSVLDILQHIMKTANYAKTLHTLVRLGMVDDLHYIMKQDIPKHYIHQLDWVW